MKMKVLNDFTGFCASNMCHVEVIKQSFKVYMLLVDPDELEYVCSYYKVLVLKMSMAYFWP